MIWATDLLRLDRSTHYKHNSLQYISNKRSLIGLLLVRLLEFTRMQGRSHMSASLERKFLGYLSKHLADGWLYTCE